MVKGTADGTVTMKCDRPCFIDGQLTDTNLNRYNQFVWFLCNYSYLMTVIYITYYMYNITIMLIVRKQNFVYIY